VKRFVIDKGKESATAEVTYDDLWLVRIVSGELGPDGRELGNGGSALVDYSPVPSRVVV
jgi:hypothetical protein